MPLGPLLRAPATHMLDPRAYQRFRKNRGALLGAGLVSLVCAAAFLGPWVSPRAPDEQFAEALGLNGIPRAPDGTFWLGADALGRDVLSRLLHGGVVSMQVALFATSLALFLGLSVGLLSGSVGGRLDQLSMRMVDVLLSLPFLLIAIAINRAVSNPSLWTMYLVLGGLSWPALARVTRSKVLQVRELEYVQAARALGLGRTQVIIKHIFPNVIGPAVVIGTTMVADMIIAESAMSFLGLGVQPPTASWGSMLYEGRSLMAYAPHLLIAPGVMIAMAVFGFNLLGEGLRDALDPKA